jgi:hypothetical protein
MTPATMTSFPPVFRKEYLDRMAALAPRPLLGADFWTKIHDAVQEQLVLLEGEVHRQLPGVHTVAGRTQGTRFSLFSYRTFSLPDSALDPVVVGIIFTTAANGVTLEGDVSGEQTGDGLFRLPRKTVANSRDELLAAACETAGQLRQSAEVVTAALQDSSRTSE